MAMLSSSDTGDPMDAAFAGMRRDMVTTVAAMAEELIPGHESNKLTQPVLEALEHVPRHRFVPEGQRDFAYLNRPLEIGYGQTISQPYIVALMTELLDISAGDRVLEIGTGCGYQTAVLAEMGADVYSVELVEQLAESARTLLQELGYQVQTRIGDGRQGWPEQAPFDAIIVTAAISEVPPALLEQLKPDGRLIIPLGEHDSAQELTLITRNDKGRWERNPVLPVRFVPLIGTQ
jgi:protein-L-isoaspartate(D-aspartate) O-methyltransferase